MTENILLIIPYVGEESTLRIAFVVAHEHKLEEQLGYALKHLGTTVLYSPKVSFSKNPPRMILS